MERPEYSMHHIRMRYTGTASHTKQHKNGSGGARSRCKQHLPSVYVYLSYSSIPKGIALIVLLNNNSNINRRTTAMAKSLSAFNCLSLRIHYVNLEILKTMNS